jgi:hypothetical protein
MIGCPGDIQEEVKIAKTVINRWTSIHAEQRGMILLPINWDTDSYPEQGGHPQKILNRQLADKSDMLIAVFGSKVGSPTNTSSSGTIEEIEHHIKAGKPVMLFFRKFNDITRISATELAKLEAFKSSIKDSGLYKEYNSESDFKEVFSNALEFFLSDHWLDNTQSTTRKQEFVELSADDIDKLKKWVASNSAEAHSVKYKGGTVFIVGDQQFDVTDAREIVLWNDFFNRLQKAGFIEIARHNRHGDPVFQLCVRAYNYIDSLN